MKEFFVLVQYFHYYLQHFLTKVHNTNKQTTVQPQIADSDEKRSPVFKDSL